MIPASSAAGLAGGEGVVDPFTSSFLNDSMPRRRQAKILRDSSEPQPLRKSPRFLPNQASALAKADQTVAECILGSALATGVAISFSTRCIRCLQLGGIEPLGPACPPSCYSSSCDFQLDWPCDLRCIAVDSRQRQWMARIAYPTPSLHALH